MSSESPEHNYLQTYLRLMIEMIRIAPGQEEYSDLLESLTDLLAAQGAALYVRREIEGLPDIFICHRLSEDLCRRLEQSVVGAEWEMEKAVDLSETAGGWLLDIIAGRQPAACRLWLYYDSPPSSERRELALTVTELLLAVVSGKGHYSELEQRLYESAALADIGRMIVSTLDMEKVLYQIVKVVAYIMNAAACLIVLHKEDEEEVEVAAAYGLERFAAERDTVRHALMLYSLIAEREGEVGGAQVGKFDGYDHLMVPLTARDRIIGAIIVYRQQEFFEHEKSLLQATAVQASIAIENARLHSSLAAFTERELRLAASIQHSLLPRSLPSSREFDFGSTISFMSEVGGDYYDTIDLGESGYGISIGDVSGKSVPAAILVGMAKYVLRTYAVIGHSPDQALAGVNRTIVNDLAPEMFISMFYGILDIGSGRLQFANAGHEPPLFFRERDHDCDFLQPTGMVLGVLSESEYSPDYRVMEPGDWLILFTDGVTEARNPEGELYGSRRVCQAVLSNHHQTAQLMAEHLFKEVYDFSGGNLRDDVAILTVNRRVVAPGD